MKQIIAYVLKCGDDHNTLNKIVRDEIEGRGSDQNEFVLSDDGSEWLASGPDGDWQPFGSPFVTKNGKCYQALVKYKKD